VEDERMTAANRSNGFDDERTYEEGRDEKDEHPLGCQVPKAGRPAFFQVQFKSVNPTIGQ